MDISVPVLEGVLAAVFAVSGLTKVSHPYQAALAIRNFRVLARVRPIAGRLTGAIELSAATAIIAGAHYWFSYTLMIALLMTFVFLISRSLARGDRFPCACFTARDQLSFHSLLRSVVLLAMAGYASVATAVHSQSLSAEQQIAGIAAGLCVALCYFVLSGLAQLSPFRARLTND